MIGEYYKLIILLNSALSGLLFFDTMTHFRQFDCNDLTNVYGKVKLH